MAATQRRNKNSRTKRSEIWNIDREVHEAGVQQHPWHHSPDLSWPTAALETRRMDEDNKGKARADYNLYQSQESANQEGASQDLYMPPQAYYQQHTLLNSSPVRVGPSRNFFEGSNGMEIRGGSFNQIHGPQLNVAVNVISSPREEHHTLQHQSQSFSQPSPLPLKMQKSNALESTLPAHEHNLHQAQFPPMARTLYEQDPSVSQMIYSPNSRKIYEQHLALKQRGFPLWIPQINKRLPIPYRRKGINIGDVGIITPSGSFSFLFNICLPSDDPINPRILPEGFVPIHPPIEPTDICEFLEFNPESYLATTSIMKVHDKTSFRGLSFKTSAAEGAILTLPEGAIALDLENVARFRTYAAENVEKWYRYVNGPRGREAKNGDIRLVTGCDKTTSWGIAAIANVAQRTTHYLKYRSLVDATVSSIPLYKWEYSGMAEAKVGPELKEIEELKRNDDSEVAVEGKYWNQCVFLRTLNPTLNDEDFEAINRELVAVPIQDSQHGSGGFSHSPSDPTTSNSQTNNTNQQLDLNSGTQKAPTELSGSSRSVEIAGGNAVKARVTMLRSLTSLESHPADILNRLLLEKFPNCRAVITQDKDWFSVVNEDDKIMPNPTEIAERVLTVNHVREEDGVVFLELKEEMPLLHNHVRIPGSSRGGVGTSNTTMNSLAMVNTVSLVPSTSESSAFSSTSHYQHPYDHDMNRNPYAPHSNLTSPKSKDERCTTEDGSVMKRKRAPDKQVVSESSSSAVPIGETTNDWVKRQKTDDGSSEGQTCLGCSVTSTPEWRRGPTGPRTLCNACGLVYAKLIKERHKGEAAHPKKLLGLTFGSGKRSIPGGMLDILNPIGSEDDDSDEVDEYGLQD